MTVVVHPMTVVVHRLTRFLLPLACAAAVSGAVLPGTAGAKLTVGISDQVPAVFSQPLFKKINITVARYFIHWNAATEHNKGDLNAARSWIEAALAEGVQPMISFGSNGSRVPSVKQYKAAIKKFMRDFPQVRTYAAWNEPDWIYIPKLANNPRLAASYFNALVQACRRCTDVAGEVYLPTNHTKYTGRYTLASYLRAYVSGLRYRPKVWALHNYYDVRTHTTSQLRTLQRYARGGQIWLTEIGGIERRGHWQFKNESVAKAGRDEAFLFSLPKRFHRVTRIYHYSWFGSASGPGHGWDSGLTNPNGTPRPAYKVVANAAGPRRGHIRRRASRRR